MARRFLISLFWAAVFLRSPGSLAQQNASPRPSPAAPQPPATAPAPRSAPQRAPAATNQAGRAAPQRRRAPAPAPARRQQQPSRERYGEIQKALAAAGYFREAPNGSWGTSSVIALQEYQKEQGLEPTGKIDAPSLIRLGLGPKYDTPTEARNPDAGPSR